MSFLAKGELLLKRMLRRNGFGSIIILFAGFDFGIDRLLLVSKYLNSSKNTALKDVTPTTILLYSFLFNSFSSRTPRAFLIYTIV